MMKEVCSRVLTLLVVLIAVSVFLNIIIPESPAQILGKFWITGKTISRSLSVSVLIRGDDSSTATSGNITFNEPVVSRIISVISGLNESAHVATIVVFGNTFPDDWKNTSQPQTNEVQESIKYFELNITNASSGEFRIYFNLSLLQLGNFSANDVRLYTFNDSNGSWGGLSTIVINAATDPLQFYAIITHFSQFVTGIIPWATTTTSTTTTTTTTSTTTTTLGSSGGSSASSGGGGGSALREKITSEKSSIKLNKKAIKVRLKQGERTSDFLKIYNDGDFPLNLSIRIEPSVDFAVIENSADAYNLNLNPGEGKNIEVKISGLNLEPEVYIGKIIVEGGEIKEIIPLIVQIDSKGLSLFDVSVDIPEKYRLVGVGKIAAADVRIYNLGTTEKINAEIEYSILNLDRDVIDKEKDNVVIQTQFQKIKEFKLPKYIPPGKYIFSVKITYYDNKEVRIATGADVFEVNEEPQTESPFLFGALGLNLNYVLLWAFVIIVVLFIFYQYKLVRVLSGSKSSMGRKETEDDLKSYGRYSEGNNNRRLNMVRRPERIKDAAEVYPGGLKNLIDKTKERMMRYVRKK